MIEEKTIYIRTFGCQMNVHDSQRMLEVLGPHGYRAVDRAEDADVILINTCSVREKSRLKVLSAAGSYARLKERRPGLVLGIAGCVAQQEGEHLLALAPAVDLVLSPDHIARLPELISGARLGRHVQTGFADADGYRFLQALPSQGVQPPTALVTVQKGCDNACAYCIVPSVRGPEMSRPGEEIVGEVERLVAAGVREITLIGQNVNSYRGLTGRRGDFLSLLRRLNAVSGLERMRFTTSNPKDFDAELAGAFGELRALCPWLHLPVQSGSSRVLAAMSRGYTREQYLEILDRVRRARPDISIGTDLIVGYPGETSADVDLTLALVRDAGFDYSYSFKYSVRPGTPASALVDDVTEDEKLRRLQVLQSLQEEVSARRLARFVGQTLPVLVEGPSRRGDQEVCGRAPGNQVVNFAFGPGAEVGQIVQVLVERAARHSLWGRTVPEEVRHAG